jgi:hypothetical protein
MIDYNLVLYIGIGLIVFGFVLFLVSAHFEREAEIKLFKLEQLDKAFRKETKTHNHSYSTYYNGRKYKEIKVVNE